MPLVQVIISMLKISEETLLEKSQRKHMTSADLFSEINQIPSTLGSVDHLLEVLETYRYSITPHLITELRKKFQVSSQVGQGNMSFNRSALGQTAGRQWDYCLL